jgi:hypothetical protein
LLRRNDYEDALSCSWDYNACPTAPAGYAQTAGSAAPNSNTHQQITERFQRMDTMMNQAGDMRGGQRATMMRQHMQTMQSQMQAMHSMMGGGMMGGGAKMKDNSAMTGNNTQILSRMQAWMDMMQKMMEQMIGQQNLMMPSPSK